MFSSIFITDKRVTYVQCALDLVVVIDRYILEYNNKFISNLIWIAMTRKTGQSVVLKSRGLPGRSE